MNPIPSPLLLDLPTGFETHRLRCRVPAAGDGAFVCEAVAASLPELRAVLAAVPWAANEPSVHASESFCRHGFATFQARTDFPFLVFRKADGLLVGACGLHRPDWQVPKLEIGYWCRTEAAGRGYTTEAVRGLVAYGRDHLGAVRLEAIVDQTNERSWRVAVAAGLQLEAVLRHQRRAPDGTLRTLCVHATIAAATRDPGAGKPIRSRETA